MLPSHIGQYRILRKIGAGGMGLVYLGEHTLLGRRAAIKTLLPTVAANHEIVERFFNEARATSAIADPGVIQIFDFGYHVDGTAYIVMELLEGEALSARLDRLGKLPLGDALRFARQIASSLGAAHARDIVHRDLKPENIFLVRDAEAQGGERTKIIDFGICKMGAGDPMLTEAGAMIGTPVYMSPEQCRGSGRVDHRSDVYAFGCLLFHLITGRPPFIGEASGELIVAHLQEMPPAASQFVPGLPEAVDALLACCLAKSPDARFASMEVLGIALGEVAVHAEAFAPAVAPPPPTVPLGRGFRSVFDANLAAAVGGSRFGATPRQRFSPAPSRPSLEIIDNDHDVDDLDDLDDLEVVVPRRRRAVRAALACVLVVGVALGLALTPLVLGDDDDEPAAPAKRAAALPIEPASPTAAPAPAPEPREPPLPSSPSPIAEVPHAGTAAPAAAEASPAAAAAVAAASPAEAAEMSASAHAAEPTLRAADEPASAPTESRTARSAETAASAAEPPLRVADEPAPAPRSHTGESRKKAVSSASRASRAGRPSSTAASGPVRSPAQAASLAATPPAAASRTPAMPVLTPMPPSSPSGSASPASSPPPAPSPAPAFAPPAPPPRPVPERTPPAPPSPPTEDLYDTR